MENSKASYFKNRLFDEKKRLLKVLNNMNNMEEYGSMDNYYSELSQYDNHPADIATEVFMKEQDEGLKNNLMGKLHEIGDSLDDINKGKYGICKICNQKIDDERLETIPYVKTCVKCSSEIANSNILFESIEDKYIISFNDSEGSAIYDREDAYQDIAENEMIPKDPSFSTGDYMGITDEQNQSEELDVENISQEYYDDTLK